jgi:hypothetical protein
LPPPPLPPIVCTLLLLGQSGRSLRCSAVCSCGIKHVEIFLLSGFLYVTYSGESTFGAKEQ